MLDLAVSPGTGLVILTGRIHEAVKNSELSTSFLKAVLSTTQDLSAFQSLQSDFARNLEKNNKLQKRGQVFSPLSDRTRQHPAGSLIQPIFKILLLIFIFSDR